MIRPGVVLTTANRQYLWVKVFINVLFLLRRIQICKMRPYLINRRVIRGFWLTNLSYRITRHSNRDIPWNISISIIFVLFYLLTDKRVVRFHDSISRIKDFEWWPCEPCSFPSPRPLFGHISTRSGCFSEKVKVKVKWSIWVCKRDAKNMKIYMLVQACNWGDILPTYSQRMKLSLKTWDRVCDINWTSCFG